MARKLGVRQGMPIAEAAALVRKAAEKKGQAPVIRSNGRRPLVGRNAPAIGVCPLSSASLHVEAHDPQANRVALEKLAMWCHPYSPHVGLEDCGRKKGTGTNCRNGSESALHNWYLSPFFAQPETLLLDATGVAPLFGGEQSFVDQVARGFQRLRFTAQLALADTVGAAWAVSHYGCKNPLVAEANIVSPGGGCAATWDGLPIRPTGKAAKSDSGCDTIEQLPLAALRLPAATVETLGQLGLQQIGELRLIPRVELQARFGTLLLKRLDQVLGAADEVIHCVQPPTDFTAQWLLEHPTDQREAIQTVIQRLVEQLARRLSDHGRGALQLVCRFGGEGRGGEESKGRKVEEQESQFGEKVEKSKGRRVAKQESRGSSGPSTFRLFDSLTFSDSSTFFEVGLFRPSAEPRHLMELVNMQMEQIKLPGSVNCISAEVPRHARLEHRQTKLFDQGERKSESRQVSVLVDRLAGRLGREAVVRCMLQSDAQPEFAYREQPLVDQSLQQSNVRSNRSFLSPLDRPLHLLKEPLAIQAVAVAPAGPPIRFRYRGHDCQVAHHWGPERIETGWWRRRGVQRDYYRVETKTGQRFWLFRQIQTGDWFLQGEFG